MPCATSRFSERRMTDPQSEGRQPMSEAMAGAHGFCILFTNENTFKIKIIIKIN
jgi:hypothetical protein